MRQSTVAHALPFHARVCRSLTAAVAAKGCATARGCTFGRTEPLACSLLKSFHCSRGRGAAQARGALRRDASAQGAADGRRARAAVHRKVRHSAHCAVRPSQLRQSRAKALGCWRDRSTMLYIAEQPLRSFGFTAPMRWDAHCSTRSEAKACCRRHTSVRQRGLACVRVLAGATSTWQSSTCSRRPSAKDSRPFPTCRGT